MKICISGFTATGKTTISENLANKLRIEHVQNSYKQHLKSDQSVSDFIDKTEEDFVRAFDRKTVELANRGDCVVSTWLSPWIIEDADLRVWLYAPFEERVKRYMRRERVDEKKAVEKIRSTDESAKKSFKKFYNIDIEDHSIFDLQINTAKNDVDKCVSIISVATIEDNKKFR